MVVERLVLPADVGVVIVVADSSVDRHLPEERLEGRVVFAGIRVERIDILLSLVDDITGMHDKIQVGAGHVPHQGRCCLIAEAGIAEDAKAQRPILGSRPEADRPPGSGQD